MAENKTSDDGALTVISDVDPPKLSDMFDRAWGIFEDVDSTSEPQDSAIVQKKVRDAVRMLEETTRMVAQLDLFSRNETMDEISTSDIRFLLLPALLGALTMKLSGRDKRLDNVQRARVYFMDYLKRCKDYDLSNFRLPANTGHEDENEQSESPPRSSDLVAMAAHRQAKIERYRTKKDLESRLLAMRQAVDSGQAEDEVSREFYLLNVRRWITVCLEEIESIDQELKILRNMDALRQNTPKPRPQPAEAPIKPFILTKDKIQAQVFGAGYPSLATMTVDDWYEQHKKKGVMPDQGVPRKIPVEEDGEAKEREEEEKERKSENEDQESLLKARSWDDWKDNHRRGYGNRQNMG